MAWATVGQLDRTEKWTPNFLATMLENLPGIAPVVTL